MTSPGEEARPLIEAVEGLRAAVDGTRLPLDLVATAGAGRTRQALLDQLDDYVLPRLGSLDAPLLAVIGGSTGAGKSTLVNSVIGTAVSAAGVIRPTTTSPVLVHNPADGTWFADRRVLPRLARVTGPAVAQAHPGAVRLVSSPELPAGMALLDAPDIDSVVHANRALAEQLLQAADLWLFVTTAARYADAVPWSLLRQASERGTAVAIVLDRVDPETIDEVRPHLVGMLREQGLGTAPVFTVPETTLTPDGILPERAIGRLRAWLDALAGDLRARSIIVAQTLRGALSSLDGRARELADAVRVQGEAVASLEAATATAYERARDEVAHGMNDGTLLRGEVLARWQELVGTGEFFRKVEARISTMRDHVTAAVKGEPPATANVGEALESGVSALIRAHAEGAAADVARTWRRLPGGEQVLAAAPDLARPAPDLPARIERSVRDWQGDLLELIRQESGSRRTNARIAAYGVNGIGLLLMLLVFSHTGGLSGAEVGIAGGTSVIAQKVLEAIFGDQAVREMADKARTLLVVRVDDLYAAEQRRHDEALARLALAPEQVQRLEAAIARIREADR